MLMVLQREPLIPLGESGDLIAFLAMTLSVRRTGDATGGEWRRYSRASAETSPGADHLRINGSVPRAKEEILENISSEEVEEEEKKK